VQTDSKFGIFASQCDGFVASTFFNYLTGAGQDTFAVRADDGFIDEIRASEIVGIDDQPLHLEWKCLRIDTKSYHAAWHRGVEAISSPFMARGAFELLMLCKSFQQNC